MSEVSRSSGKAGLGRKSVDKTFVGKISQQIAQIDSKITSLGEVEVPVCAPQASATLRNFQRANVEASLYSASQSNHFNILHAHVLRQLTNLTDHVSK